MPESQIPPHLLSPPDQIPDLGFRPAAAADCPTLHRCCYSDRPRRQFQEHCAHLLRWQEKGRCHWLVVEIDGKIVASGQLVLYPHSAELANMAVADSHQGQGIGTALIGVLTAVARHLGLNGVEISVAAGNARALALYRRLGFAEDRRLQLRQEEPAIILHKSL